MAYSPISHIIKANAVYSLAPPANMKSLRGRKVALVSLVDTILSNLSKAGRARLEVRAPQKEGQTVAQALESAKDMLGELCEHGEYVWFEHTPLALRQMPLTFYRDFLKEELKGALDGGTFSGMRDSGPTEEQQDLEQAMLHLQSQVLHSLLQAGWQPLLPTWTRQPPPQQGRACHPKEGQLCAEKQWQGGNFFLSSSTLKRSRRRVISPAGIHPQRWLPGRSGHGQVTIG